MKAPGSVWVPTTILLIAEAGKGLGECLPHPWSNTPLATCPEFHHLFFVFFPDNRVLCTYLFYTLDRGKGVMTTTWAAVVLQNFGWIQFDGTLR